MKTDVTRRRMQDLLRLRFRLSKGGLRALGVVIVDEDYAWGERGLAHLASMIKRYQR